MIGNKLNDFLKYKRLGNKTTGELSKIGNKFNKSPKHDLAIHKEFSEGAKPTKISLHDSSDLGFDNDKPSSHLEKKDMKQNYFIKLFNYTFFNTNISF